MGGWYGFDFKYFDPARGLTTKLVTTDLPGGDSVLLAHEDCQPLQHVTKTYQLTSGFYYSLLHMLKVKTVCRPGTC